MCPFSTPHFRWENWQETQPYGIGGVIMDKAGYLLR